MLSAEASSAICVQRFDDSRNSAIHITYRISLRSSSLREPRYPLLRVVFCFWCVRGLTLWLQSDCSRFWFGKRASTGELAPSRGHPGRPHHYEASADCFQPTPPHSLAVRGRRHRVTDAPLKGTRRHRCIQVRAPKSQARWQGGVWCALWTAPDCDHRERTGLNGGFIRVGSIDSMILPQVHLRKPCYDFSFL